jgi:hypothetical protein
VVFHYTLVSRVSTPWQVVTRRNLNMALARRSIPAHSGAPGRASGRNLFPALRGSTRGIIMSRGTDDERGFGHQCL